MAMKTKTKNPGNSPPAHPSGTCVPCEIPGLCRTSYYTGKLLTARDFCQEQRYHSDKLRLHHMHLHGWGAVCGLRVKPHPHCPSLRIVVEPGLAIDHCGREVRLLEEVELHLPQPAPAPESPDPCPPDPAAPAEPGKGYGPEASREETLWICLRYCEREEEFSPAPFDECACTGTLQKPNRVCESYYLCMSTEEPKFLKEIERHKHCECEDCRDLYKGMLDECKPVAVDCIPLAVIKHFRPGKDVCKEMIDNHTHRPFLPSVHRLDQVVRCILEQMPRCKLTRICGLNWRHASEFHCHEFLHRFIGHDKGFDITFDGPVKPDGINRRSFQALVVHHPDAPDQPHRMEIAPAQVDVLSPTNIRLRINEHYAKRHLDLHDFDLFITLKCDVVVDHHGRPVDGDLLARLEDEGRVYVVETPTGDGVQGGLFESWIRVRGGEGHADHR
jgi:hypothetical protein